MDTASSWRLHHLVKLSVQIRGGDLERGLWGGGGLEMEIGSIVAGYSLDKNLLFRLVYFYWHSVRKCQLLSRESDRGAGPLSHFVPLRYRWNHARIDRVHGGNFLEDLPGSLLGTFWQNIIEESQEMDQRGHQRCTESSPLPQRFTRTSRENERNPKESHPNAEGSPNILNPPPPPQCQWNLQKLRESTNVHFIIDDAMNWHRRIPSNRMQMHANSLTIIRQAPPPAPKKSRNEFNQTFNPATASELEYSRTMIQSVGRDALTWIEAPHLHTRTNFHKSTICWLH